VKSPAPLLQQYTDHGTQRVMLFQEP